MNCTDPLQAFTVYIPPSEQMEEEPSTEPVDYSKPGTWICDKVRMVKTYTLLDSHCKHVLSLPAELRQELIRDSGKEALTSKKQKRSWMVSTYRSQDTELKDARPIQDALESFEAEKTETTSKARPTITQLDEFKFRISLPPEPQFVVKNIDQKTTIPFQFNLQQGATQKKIDVVYADPDPSKEFGTLQFKLPSLKAIDDDKKILVVFDRKLPLLDKDGTEEDKTAAKDKSKGKKSSKHPGIAAQNIQLNVIGHNRLQPAPSMLLRPQECSLYSKGKAGKWHLDYCRVRRGEELVPNPLVLESGPVLVDTNDKMRVVENDGEYYLNQEILTTLYNKKAKDAEQQEEFVLPWFYYSSKPPYTLPDISSDRYHFFLERHNSAHTIGVYVNTCTRDGEIHVYLHETEGAAESTSIKVREQVQQMMNSLYPDKDIHLFFPQSVLQRDFAGCGVFAFKAMSYFRKHPEEMDTWMQTMLNKTIEDEPDDKNGEENDESSSYCSDEGDTPTPMEHRIPLGLLPPELLKIYDNKLISTNPDQPKLSNKQLTAPVKSDGTTLHDYLFSFEREVQRVDGKSTTTVNTGSAYMRYNMLEKFQAIKEQEEQKLREQMTKAAAPSQQFKRKREETPLLHCPTYIVNSLDQQEVNQWLEANEDEPFNDDEWRMLLKHNDYLSRNKSMKDLKKKHENTYRWIRQAKRIPPVTPRGILLSTWLADDVGERSAKRRRY